jgi:hypothetical protein
MGCFANHNDGTRGYNLKYTSMDWPLSGNGSRFVNNTRNVGRWRPKFEMSLYTEL